MGQEPYKTCNTCGRTYNSEQDFLVKTSRWRLCDRGNLWFNCSCNSTNMIIKGKFDWYSPEKFLSTPAKSVFNILPSILDLPHIPTSVMKLQQLIQAESTSATELAAVSRQDPLIAGNILKIANEMKTNDNTAIESLEHAISYIGLNALSDIILTASITAFPFQTKVFDSDDFWEEAFLTGKVSEFLSRRFAKQFVSDEVYLAGCLANVGKVVMAICLPDMADKIATDCRDLKKLWSWSKAEKHHKAHEHGILGEIASAIWGLPDYILQVSSNHHLAPKADTPLSITEVVCLGNQLAHWIRLEPSKIDQDLLDQTVKYFNLSSKQLDQLIDELIPLTAAS